MPLSWPYGVTGPVVGQMFHVKHSLWRRWCSRRRRPRPPARLGDLASLGAASRSPPVPSGPSVPSTPAAPGVLARPGPATAHGHRSLALPPPTGTAAWPCRHSPVPRPALPPPTAPPPVIPNVQLASESPVIRGYVERYTFSTDLRRHFLPISVSRPLAAQPGPGRWQASWCPVHRCSPETMRWSSAT